MKCLHHIIVAQRSQYGMFTKLRNVVLYSFIRCVTIAFAQFCRIIVRGDDMTQRKAKWQNDYISKAYDRINLTVPKGKKEVIQTAAQQSGESVNGFIWRLIQAELDRMGIK